MAPDGYWYIIAYEEQPQTSTWGVSVDWKRFVYYTGRPISGMEAQSTALTARFQHDRPYTPGALRSYWWNGRGWVLWTRDAMVADWGNTRATTAPPPVESPPPPENDLGWIGGAIAGFAAGFALTLMVRFA